VDGQKVVGKLREKGIWIAGGQAQAKGKIFRIAHMGFIDETDLLGTIGGLEVVLNDLGYKVELGVGVKAAQTVLGKEAGA
jgi:aspartate aminotransferase-like enzyme